MFVGAVLMTGWNLLVAFKDGSRWTRKFWAVLLFLAALLILYVAHTFGLTAMTVQY